MLIQALSSPTDKRMFVLASALNAGYTIDTLYDLTRIDKWFLNKFKNIISLAQKLERIGAGGDSCTDASFPVFDSVLGDAKRLGFSDRQIAELMKR